MAALLSWWYGRGLRGQAQRVLARIDRTAEFFSISLLFRTLFDPFRQIDANPTVGGSMDMRMHAAFDRMFSRLIGFMVRSFSIGIGFGAILLIGLIGLLQLVLWPFVPVLPLIGLLLVVLGVGP